VQENRKTISYLNTKKWYKTLKVINICFVFCSIFIGLISCITFLIDGQDNVNFFLKALLIIGIFLVFYIISEVPKRIFYSLWGVPESKSIHSKTILISGILCLIFLSAVITTMILPFGFNTKKFTITDESPVGSTQFVKALSGLTNSPIQYGDEVVPIDTVDRFLPILLSGIDNAKTSINFTTFAWADGPFSEKVFSSLIKSAKRGVQVRLLLDALGSHGLSQKNIKLLEDAGGRVEKYHEFNMLDPVQYNSRDHMRSIVIDGEIGFTGGMGITDDWLSKKPGKKFQDMMFEFKGTMAQSLQNTFNKNWNTVTGEVLNGSSFYPSVPFSNDNSFIGITSIPSEDYQPVRDAFMLTMLSAKKKLYIVNPYIIPDEGMLMVLEDKAREGVDVRIVSPGPISDAPLMRMVWHTNYERLLASGVKIYEYQPSMIHTKFIIADDVWSLVGSANIDNRSESINNENIMGIVDEKLASTLDKTFTVYLKDSKEFTLDVWKKENNFLKNIYSKMLLILFKQY